MKKTKLIFDHLTFIIREIFRKRRPITITRHFK